MAMNNPGFESGSTSGWVTAQNGARPLNTVSVVNTPGYVDTGTYALEMKGLPTGDASGSIAVNTWKPLINPGSQVSVTARVRSLKDVKGYAFAWVGVRFYRADGAFTDSLSRMLATNEMRSSYTTLSYTATAPADAMYASMILLSETYNDNRRVYFDTCDMKVEEASNVVTLTYPVNGVTYTSGADVPFRAKIASGFTATSVRYVVTNVLTAASTTYTPANDDWSMLVNNLSSGQYSVVAVADIGGNSFSSDANTFSVGEAPVKDIREFNASNSHAHLILSNLVGPSLEIPSISVVTGCTVDVTYSLEVLSRTLDKDTAKESADPNMVFNVLKEGTLELALLSPIDDTSFSVIGSPAVAGISLDSPSFALAESGTSGEFAWNRFVSTEGTKTVTVGTDSTLFGIASLSASDFLNTSLGVRFYPVLNSIPEASDAGEVCVRFKLDQVKVAVYFDAGSVEYYFVSPEGNVIKGTLASANVLNGDLRNGDGEGHMQLLPDLDGSIDPPPPVPTGTSKYLASASLITNPETGYPAELFSTGSKDTSFVFASGLPFDVTSSNSNVFKQIHGNYVFVGNFSGSSATAYVVVTDVTGEVLDVLYAPNKTSLVADAVFMGNELWISRDAEELDIYSVEADGSLVFDSTVAITNPDSSTVLLAKARQLNSDEAYWSGYVQHEGSDRTHYFLTRDGVIRKEVESGPLPWGYGPYYVLEGATNWLITGTWGEGDGKTWMQIIDGDLNLVAKLNVTYLGGYPAGSSVVGGPLTTASPSAWYDETDEFLYVGINYAYPPATGYRIGRIKVSDGSVDTDYMNSQRSVQMYRPDRITNDPDTGAKTLVGRTSRTVSGHSAVVVDTSGNTISEFTIPTGMATSLVSVPYTPPGPPPPLPPGTLPVIHNGYTIHSTFPPTEANKVGDVGADMRYNGLSIKYELDNSRTKAQFITANFYGDERMDSMYGVNGVDRAFSYNGEYFYKIYTQADADKDRPRHVAYHHAHLALGYKEGRVDVSVAGEPWNFSGLDGASSWGIGDSVTGMIPLSGTVLGIFCDNSVVGLSGTTVDNFATQVISPRMGALEYTVVDMGYPVYANSYGIYTLNQTQQYGDFLGNPLSQDISTWIRPRLNTDPTALASVNMAYPVRSKNQYRLSFTDNHILTMTMNYGQQSAPTFSLHNYGMTPTAVSSQLDQHGREKLHFTASPSAPPIPPAECAVIPTSAWSLDEDENEALRLDPMEIENAPSWLTDGSLTDIYFDFYDNGTEVHFYLSGNGTYVPTSSVPSDTTGKGTIRGEWETETSVCVQWSTPQQPVDGLLWERQYIVNGDMNGVAIPDPSIPTEVYFSSGNGGVLRLIPPFYYEELAQGQTIKLISCQYGQAYSVGQDGWIGGCDTSNWDIWWTEVTNDQNPLIGMPYAATSVPYGGTTNAAVIAEDGSIWMTVSGTWTKIHDAFWGAGEGFGYIQSHRIGSTVMVTVYSEDRTEAHSYVFTNSSAGVWRSAPVGTSVAHDRVANIEDGELVLRLLVNPSSWTWVVAASVSVDPGTEIVNVSVGTAKDRTDPETFIYLQSNYTSTSAYVYRQGELIPCKTHGYSPDANSGPGVVVRQNHPTHGLIYQQVCREGPFVFMSYAP